MVLEWGFIYKQKIALIGFVYFIFLFCLLTFTSLADFLARSFFLRSLVFNCLWLCFPVFKKRRRSILQTSEDSCISIFLAGICAGCFHALGRFQQVCLSFVFYAFYLGLPNIEQIKKLEQNTECTFWHQRYSGTPVRCSRWGHQNCSFRTELHYNQRVMFTTKEYSASISVTLSTILKICLKMVSLY